jgi:hypothetical protein
MGGSSYQRWAFARIGLLSSAGVTTHVGDVAMQRRLHVQALAAIVGAAKQDLQAMY